MRRRIGATVVIGGSHVQGTRSQVLYCSPAVQPYTRGLIVSGQWFAQVRAHHPPTGENTLLL